VLSPTQPAAGFLRKQKNHNAPRTSRTTTPPAAIAPITPPESLVEDGLAEVVGLELIFPTVAVVTVTVAVETIPPLVMVVSVVYVVREADVIPVYAPFCVALEVLVPSNVFVPVEEVDDAEDWTTALVPLIPMQLLRLSFISSANPTSEVDGLALIHAIH